MDQKNNNIGKILISVFFMIWFVLSIAAMIYFAKTGRGAVSVMVLGQFFLLMGIFFVIASISDKQFNPIILLFPAAGIGCIVGGAIYQYGTETVIANLDKIMPDICAVIFLIAGIIMVGVRVMRTGKKKSQCTVPVTATCVDIATRFHKGHKSVCPTYEIFFRDESIRICNNTYTSMNDMTVGEKRVVYVNPSEPTDFYEPKEEKIAGIVTYVIGIGAIASGILIFVMLHLV